MLSASAFGSADNTYLDLDYSGYQKNLIQWLLIGGKEILIFAFNHNMVAYPKELTIKEGDYYQKKIHCPKSAQTVTL